MHWKLSPRLLGGLAACAAIVLLQARADDGRLPPSEVRIVGDGIPQALTAQPGDAARGRAIVTDRSLGLCLLCHSGPFPEQRFQGDLAPSLAGAGARLTLAQLRLRMVDSSRMNPDTIMPSYYRLEGFNRVAAQWQGKTILSAQQVEDVVAFLASMRE
jgi:sulfur-oxidizing protein SoxX